MSHTWARSNGPSSYARHGSDTNQMSDRPKGFDMGNYQSTGQHGSSMNKLRDRVEQLTDFFGHPNHDVNRIEQDYINSHRYGDVEYEDYPEAFKPFEGKNGFIEKVLIEKVKASENWQLTRMAPWVYSESSTFAWSEARFHKHMLDREPEEAVPRMTTHTYSSGKASMVRYGICMMLERNFFLTPKGQQTYLFNIEQLRIATVETASHGAVVSVLEHIPFEDINDKYKQSMQRTKQDLNTLFTRETSEFAIVHKSKDGYRSLKAKLMRVLSDRCGSESGDFTVLPQGMLEFTKESIDDNRFFLDGNKQNPAPLLTASVVQSRGFSYGEHSPAVDPFFRDTTVGGFGTLSDMNARGRIEEYETRHMDCRIFDEGTDKFEWIRYADLYKMAGVWDFKFPAAPLTNPIGKGYGQDWHCYTYGQLMRKDNNINRTIDKLLLIKDEGLRNEFIASLRLLPKGDVRTQLDGHGFPKPGTFQMSLFDRMCSPEMGWDKTYSKAYTVQEQARIESRKRSHSGLADPEAEQEIREYDELRKSQRGGAQKRARVVPTTADFFDDSMYEDVPETPGSGLQDRIVSSRGPNGPVFRYAPGSQGLRRPKASPITHFDNNMDATRDATPADALEEVVKAAQKVPFDAANDKIDAVVITVNGQATKASKVTEAVFNYASTLANFQGASDSQKLQLLSQLHRIVLNETSLVAGQAADKFLARVISNLAPFLAKVETSALFESSTSNQTPLEAEYLKDPSFNFAAAPAVIADTGRWKPEGDDDGQIELLFSPLPAAQGIALPHDSVASTLTRDHSVLFKLSPGAGLIAPVIKGIKQSRADSLTWSIVLSQLAQTKGDAAALGKVYDMLLAAPTVYARLQRAAQQMDRDTLPSQQHLRTLITKLEVYLRAVLTDVDAAVGAPAKKAAALLAVFPAATLKTLTDKSVFDDAAVNAFNKVNKHGYTVLVKSAAGGAEDEIAKEQIKSVFRFLAAGGSSVEKIVARNVASGVLESIARRLAQLTVKTFTEKEYEKADSTSLGKQLFLCWGAIKGNYPALSPSEEADLKFVMKAMSIVFTKKSITINGVSTDVGCQYGVPNQNAIYLIDGPASAPAPSAVNKPSDAFSWSRTGLAYLLDHASLSSGAYYRFCVDHDIPVPFFVRYWRPSKTWSMGTVLHMVSGANGAAKTFYKNPDFMVAENAAQKMVFGHFTTYFTTICQAPEKIAVAKNVFCRGYVGGNDTKVWNPLSLKHGEAWRSGNMDFASMFITLGLMNQSTPFANWLSVSGVMPPSLNVDSHVAKGIQYPGCRGVSAMWNFRADGGDGMTPTTRRQYSCKPNPSERRFNVICMQEAQIDIHNALNPSKPIAIQDCGHWGSWVHEGCGKVRAGIQMHLQPPSYLDTNTYTLR